MKIDKDRVIFRKFKNGEVIALLPDVESWIGEIATYMHIGQHGSANYPFIISHTTPASEDDYAELLDELETIGYYPVVLKRITNINWHTI